MAKQDHIPSVLMPHASTDSTRINRLLYAGGARVLETGKRMEGKGACKSRVIPPPPSPSSTPVAMLHPRSTYGLSGGSNLRNAPSPHSSVLLIGDVRVSIDRRTLVKRNPCTRERRVPYLVNVNGRSVVDRPNVD